MKKTTKLGNMFRPYSDMSRAIAGPEDHLLVGLGGDIMPQILIRDKEYLLLI